MDAVPLQACMQLLYDDARDDFDEADKCAVNHFPGHPNYALERYLRCLAVLALADFQARHNVGTFVMPAPPANPEGT